MRVSEKKLARWNRSAGGLLYPEEIQGLARIAQGDQIRTRGFVTIVEKKNDEDARGRVTSAGKNLILNLGREAMRLLLAQTAEANGAAGTKDLGYLAVGIGAGTFVATSTALVSESTGVTAMAAPSGVARPLMTPTALPPGPPFTSSLWTAQFSTSELNVAPYNVITEMMIYCLNNSTAFAARSPGTQTKSSGYAIEIRWLISH